MDYEAAYAALAAQTKLMDEAYGVRLDLFRRLLDDGKWREDNEYTFTRKTNEGWYTLNLRDDTLRQKGITRSFGLDYVVNMMEANGGVLDGVLIKRQKPEGPIVLKPPYRLAELSSIELKYHERIPPEREQLNKVMRFDPEIGRLYHVLRDDEGRYEDGATSAPAYFIEVAGHKYARWRVISQLLLGNPHGVRNPEAAQILLDGMPATTAEFKETAKLAQQDFFEHMNTRGPDYRERRTLRLTEPVRALRAKIDALEAENGKLKLRLAGFETQAVLRTKRAQETAEKENEKEKEVISDDEKMRRRAERLYRRSLRGLK